jgi:hypothetical protein
LAPGSDTVSCPELPQGENAVKKLLLLLVISLSPGAFPAAQEQAPETRDAAELGEQSVEPEQAELPGGREARPKRDWKAWREKWLPGLVLGLEGGSHEYPLEVWYPGQGVDGYSIRSPYLKPAVYYDKIIRDFTLSLELNAVIDLGAPDPAPGARALNAKSADRANWYTIYAEEEFAYAFSSLFSPDLGFPGVLSVYLYHRNYFYVFPEFPGFSGQGAWNKASGVIEPGFSYSRKADFGNLEFKLGLPVAYADRYMNDTGLGLEFTAGYRDIYHSGFGFELSAKIAFLPSAEYAGTDLSLGYDWEDFSAELEISAAGAFETIKIKPSAVYRFYNFTFTAGMEISEIRNYPAFSPYMGFTWAY